MECHPERLLRSQWTALMEWVLQIDFTTGESLREGTDGIMRSKTSGRSFYVESQAPRFFIFQT
jgi:hypothetical protein